MPQFVLAVDNGTTSTRAIIFDEAGNKVGTGQLETTQVFPQAGWVEQDPVELVTNTKLAIAQALKAAQLTSRDIATIGITTQRETTIVWNRKTGEPVYNAIVWQDTRTQEWMADLATGSSPIPLSPAEIARKTGLPMSAYFSASKIRWILENVPGTHAAAEKGELAFGTPDTWLLWNLTGGVSDGQHRTDVTNASRTLLMDLETLTWDQQLLNVFDIPMSMLPQIHASSSDFGVAIDPLAGVPITAIIGDQQAAAFGQGCYESGDSKNTYGTGNFLMVNTGTSPVHSHAGLITTVAYQLDGQPAHYALEGSVAVSGSLIQWLRDSLGIISSAAEVEGLATSVSDCGDVYLVPAFSGLYAPYWREDARGVIVGLTRFATKAHIARASLEAVAFQTREVIDAVQQDADVTLHELRVDGGMVANEFLMQFQADMLGIPVIKPHITETTALGAAFVAGLHVGIWKNLSDIQSHWREDKRWLPKLDPETRELRLARWKQAVERSFNWIQD